MHYSVAPLLIAGAGLAIQAVSASPINVIAVSSHIEFIPNNVNAVPAPPEAMVFRVGLAGAGAAPVTPMPTMRTRKGCGKALQLSNTLRQTFGLPVIEGPTSDWKAAVMPDDGKMIDLHPEDHEDDFRTVYLPHPRPERYGMYPEEEEDVGDEVKAMFDAMFDEEPSFVERIHSALLELGTWEARAVAFVLGCGIGVLMRMLWIFAVLLMRELAPSREEDTASVEEVRELAPADDELPEYADDVKAPAYTDEKTAIA